MVPIDANGSRAVSKVSASPLLDARRRNTLVHVVSTPAAFCLQSLQSAAFRASALSAVDCPPNFSLRAACSESVPGPQSTSPVLQSCVGRELCVRVGGNRLLSVLWWWPWELVRYRSFVLLYLLLSSAAPWWASPSPLRRCLFNLASPLALDSFPSRTRCLSVSSLMVLRPPSGGAARGGLA
jgi:hypothetical protein